MTEGSGLIDIRALASAHKTMKSTAAWACDDGLSADPFTTGTMSMPALMPMGSHRSNKPLIIGGVIGGVLLFGLIGAVAYLATRDNTPQVTEKIYIQEKLVQPEQPAVDKAAADEAAKAANSALEGETD
ncbi:MAG: hypothetical protein R3E66_16390 [bacterium]